MAVKQKYIQGVPCMKTGHKLEEASDLLATSPAAEAFFGFAFGVDN